MLKDKNICFVMNKMDSGGAERVVSILANSFVELGINVDMVVNEDKESFYELDKRVNYNSMHLSYNNLNFIKSIKNNLVEVYNLIRYFKKHKPDIVISFIRNVPTIFACKVTNTKVIISERNNPIYDPPNPLWRVLRKLFYPMATGIVFQTKGAKEYFSEKIQRNSIIIPNPINQEVNNVINTEKKDLIVSVGRLATQKDQKTLLKSFRYVLDKHPNYKLVLYGDGKLKNDLIDFAKELDISNNVIFAGKTNDIYNRVSEAKVYVLSSIYEGYPNSLIEAMAVGTAVVSTNCGYGPSEVIKNGKNGFLVEVGDSKDMGTKIEKLITNNNLNKTFTENAILLKEHLSEEKITSKWIDYITKIV